MAAEGFALFWEKEWRAYEKIEREIAGCDALLAVVDDTWTCSSWMASEVTWACGEAGAVATSNQRIDRIPVFFYVATDDFERHFLHDHAWPVRLSRDVQSAIREITAALRSS